MAFGWRSGAGVLATALLVVGSRAVAAPQSAHLDDKRVLLVHPLRAGMALDEAFNRLRAELELSEFDVTTVDEGSEPGSPRAIAEGADRTPGMAVIAWVRQDAAAEAVVWMPARVGVKAWSRSFDLGPSREGPNLLAVRVVDFLRSSWRESKPQARPNVAAVSEARAVPSPSVPAVDVLPSWEIRAEALQIGAGSAIGAGYGPSLGISYRIVDRWRVGAIVAGPLLGASWTASQGSASVWQAVFIAEGSFSIWRNTAFGLAAVAGAGVYHLDARGEPEPSLISRTSGVTSALASVGACGELRLTRGASIVAGARLIALAPRPGVAVNRDQTTLTLPLALLSAGAKVGF